MADKNTIASNLALVKSRIEQAALRTGRDPSGIRLVAVTKAVGLEEAQSLLSLGQRDLAENRVQDARPKTEALPQATWHLIGHLQKNKVNKVLGRFHWIHSLDSVELIHFIGRRLQQPLYGLIEVNTSGEAQKFGIEPGALPEILEAAAAFELLKIRGLMTMAPFISAEETRPFFRRLRILLERANEQNCYPRPMSELSMGMSNDFEVAVEEGATMVRVGTALFEAGS